MRITTQAQRVLLVMLASPRSEHYGLELAKATGLRSGTLYPVLARLEGAGWIDGSWEKIDPHTEGRPPRRYYRLTAAGMVAVQDLRAELERLLHRR